MCVCVCVCVCPRVAGSCLVHSWLLASSLPLLRWARNHIRVDSRSNQVIGQFGSSFGIRLPMFPNLEHHRFNYDLCAFGTSSRRLASACCAKFRCCSEGYTHYPAEQTGSPLQLSGNFLRSSTQEQSISNVFFHLSCSPRSPSFRAAFGRFATQRAVEATP